MSDKNNPSIWIQKIAILLKPSRTIPHTPWRADSTWSLGFGRYHLQRLIILLFGLSIFGVGEAFLVVSSLGNSPWVVLWPAVCRAEPLARQPGVMPGPASQVAASPPLEVWERWLGCLLSQRCPRAFFVS